MAKVSLRCAFAISFLLGLMLAIALLSSPAYAASTLETATKKHSVAPAHVVSVSTVDELGDALNAAGAKATAKNRQAVYVKNGTYSLDKSLDIPENVVLICQSDKTIFVATKSMTSLFTVAGSIYGGTYNAQHRASYALCFDDKNFRSTKNGQIENATVKQATSYGIVADSSHTKNVHVVSCVVSQCDSAGIAITNGATAYAVNSNKIYSNKGIGLYVSGSTVANIKKNNIYKNKGIGLAITGDSARSSVTRINGNRIASNVDVGIYVSDKAKVSAFVSNKVTGNKNSGLCIDGGALVKGFAKNRFGNNAPYNVLVFNKASKLVLGNSNTLSKPGDTNIVLDKGAALVVAGSKNKITKAPSHGIFLNGASTMKYKSGSKNSITKCGANGIFVNGKSTCVIKKMSFAGISSSAVYVAKGSKFKQKNCGLSTSKKATRSKQVYRA